MKLFVTLELCQENYYKNTGLGAKWRENRLTSMQFLETLLQAGFVLSPLIGLPAFTLSFVVLDWLHVVDLGVSADLIGNLFHEITASACPLFPGERTKENRLNALWAKLRTWYDECKPASRLDNLTFEMLSGGKQKGLNSKRKGGSVGISSPLQLSWLANSPASVAALTTAQLQPCFVTWLNSSDGSQATFSLTTLKQLV